MNESIPIEKEKVAERIGDIKRALAKLEAYRNLSADDLAKDEDAFALVAYWLRIALEEFIQYVEQFLQKQERK